MEKNELGTIIVYLIMFALIYLVGQTVIVVAISALELSSAQAWPYVLICMAISVVVFALVYEIGHIIGAKIGGYKLTYFNMFGLCWYKKENKWAFKFEGFEGLFSETRFTPITKDKKSNPASFLRGGILSFLVSVIVCLILYMIKSIPAQVKYGVLIYFGVGLVFMLYNIIPMRTDILNDGYRLKLLGKKENADAYNEFMRIEEDIRVGKNPENIPVYKEITPMTVLINRYAYYECLNKKDYKKAEEIVDTVLVDINAIETITGYRYRFQKLYFIILNSSIEEASKYYWDVLESDDRKMLAKDKDIATKRVYLLVSGLINESLSESEIAIEGMKKRINHMSDAIEKKVELELYEEAIKMVSAKLGSEDLYNVF